MLSDLPNEAVSENQIRTTLSKPIICNNYRLKKWKFPQTLIIMSDLKFISTFMYLVQIFCSSAKIHQLKTFADTQKHIRSTCWCYLEDYVNKHIIHSMHSSMRFYDWNSTYHMVLSRVVYEVGKNRTRLKLVGQREKKHFN